MADDEGAKSNEQVMVALIAVPIAVIALLGWVSTKMPNWAFRNHLLVNSSEAVVTLPGTDGLGLDWRRLLLALALLVAAGALIFAKAREKLKAARNLELNTDAEMSRDEAEHEVRMGKHKEKLGKKWWDDFK